MTWKHHPHGPLQRLEENLLAVEGSHPAMPFSHWMVVARLSGGRLLIHNPVALDAAGMQAIEEFGTPAWILIPNRFHGRDAVPFKQRYPQARVICPEASAPSLRRQKKPIDGFLDEFAGDAATTVEAMDGVKTGEGVLRVTGAGGRVTLAFADVLFNVPHGSGFKSGVLRLIGSSGGPRVTPLMKLAGVRDKAALAAHLGRLAATPGLCRLIPGHGEMISEGAAQTLAAVARRLSPAA